VSPDFFDLIGITPSGAPFELALWSALLVGCVWMLESEFRSRASGVSVANVVVAAAFGAFAVQRIVATASTGALFFGVAGLQISTYGVLYAVGFAAAVGWAALESRRAAGSLTPSAVADLGFWILVSGFIGARGLGWLTELPGALAACREHTDALRCASLLRPWDAPSVWLGGVAGGCLAAAVWARRVGIPLPEVADLAAPAIALGHAIGRVGCFAAGCCFGATSSRGVAFPMASPAFTEQYLEAGPAERATLSLLGESLPVIPTQLLEAGLEVALFAALVAWGSRARPGARFAAWMVAYGAGRLALETLRGDAERGMLAELVVPAFNRLLGLAPDHAALLSTSQVASAVLLVAGFLVFLRVARGPLTPGATSEGPGSP
jgi:phosphatidylglycerol:prolipoprotein diacylglycerol transferase